MSLFRIFAVAPLLLQSLAHAQVTGERYLDWLSEYRRAGLSRAHKTEAARYEYLFVAGFLNEGIPGYFFDNIEELKAQGVPANQIHVIRPPSRHDIDGNSNRVMTRVIELFDRTQRKIVLIGHSKGAVESLAAVTDYPNLAAESLQAVLLIQGAFGGSGIADIIRKEPNLPKKELNTIPSREKRDFQITLTAGRLLDRQIQRGFESLTSAEGARLRRTFRRKAEQMPQSLLNRIYYVTGFEHPKDATELVDCTGWYLWRYYGENDGLVRYHDQYVAGVGTLLPPIVGDHADLTVAWPISNRGPRLRQHLTRVLLRLALEQ